jgi:fluoroquinolone resistance protein
MLSHFFKTFILEMAIFDGMDYTAENQRFSKGDFAGAPLQKGEYENCIFNGCDFSNADFSETKFIECGFHDCNLSMVKLVKTMLQTITFKNCKMLGLQFDTCREFGLAFSFEGCTLDHSSFFRTKIRKTVFRNTHLQEVDFTECDLGSAVFDQCDLTRAKFENTLLEKADFRSAFNYSIDAEINRIKKAKFSLSGVGGLLDKYDIEIGH